MRMVNYSKKVFQNSESPGLFLQEVYLHITLLLHTIQSNNRHPVLGLPHLEGFLSRIEAKVADNVALSEL